MSEERLHDAGSGGSRRTPKLLSGDPQIPKADGDAPVRAYVEAMPGWKRDVGELLDEIVSEVVPNVARAVRWNSPFYGVGSDGWFMSFHCFTKYVNVTFFMGTSLVPMPPGHSKQDGLRYLDTHETDEIDRDLLATWVRQAQALPGWEP